MLTENLVSYNLNNRHVMACSLLSYETCFCFENNGCFVNWFPVVHNIFLSSSFMEQAEQLSNEIPNRFVVSLGS